MSLTEDQIKFIDECKLEFSDRFTDADLQYKKVYEEGIPPPPIMYPWHTRSRTNNRFRAGGSMHHDFRSRLWYTDDKGRSHSYNNRQDRPSDRPY